MSHPVALAASSRASQAPAAVPLVERPSNQAWITLAALLGLGLLLRLVAMSQVPLIAEEAYYWMYSKQPQLSYFDHPPMVAWTIKLGTVLFGDTEFGVRVVGNLLMVASSILLYHVGRIWFSRTAGVAAALLLHLLPVYYGIGLVAPMDAALIFFWLACLLGVSRAVKDGDARGWYVAGLALGCALLSKYSAVLLVPSVLVALLARRPWRRHLLSPHPYLALALAGLLFLPVVVWNAQHDWASFRFQFIDRYARDRANVRTPLIFLATQFLVLTPLLLPGLLWLARRLGRHPRRALAGRYWLALSFCLPGLAVVALKALRSEIHVNWTAPLYLSLLPVVGHLWFAEARRHGHWPRALPRAASVLAAINVLAVLYLLVLHPRLRWPHAFGPWHDVASVVEDWEDRLEAETQHEPLIIADGKYRLASLMAFYRLPIEGHPSDPRDAIDHTTSQWPLGRQGLGYRFWSDRRELIGRDAVYVTDDRNFREHVERWFESVSWIDDPRLTQGPTSYHVAVCRRLLPAGRTHAAGKGGAESPRGTSRPVKPAAEGSGR